MGREDLTEDIMETEPRDNAEVADYDTVIPDDVFPVPANDISYEQSATIIFDRIAGHHRLFRRGGNVVEVVEEEDGPVIQVVSPARFASMVETFGNRVCRKEVQTKTEDGKPSKKKVVWRRTLLTVTSAQVILASQAAQTHLKEIHQVAQCPILLRTPDGPKIIHSGFCRRNDGIGIYITNRSTVPTVPLETAIAAVLSLTDDLHFKTPADKSRALAHYISPAIKMGGWLEADFPLDMSEAEESQSGKTYRQKVVAAIYGETCPLSAGNSRGGLGSLDETVSGLLLAGRPFIQIDNVRGKIDSPVMEMALRGSGRVQCRALRVSGSVAVKPFIWQMSSNGAEMTPDIANRSIITRIKKRAEDQPFKEYAEGDLFKHVVTNQSFFLGCVFAVVKTWADEMCPRTTDSRHDFREWTQSMDWIVQNVLGWREPLLDGHREQQARASSARLQWLRELGFAVVRDGKKGQFFSASNLADLMDEHGIVMPGATARDSRFPSMAVGRALGPLFKAAEGARVDVDGLSVYRFTRELLTHGSHNKKAFHRYVVQESGDDVAMDRDSAWELDGFELSAEAERVSF